MWYVEDTAHDALCVQRRPSPLSRPAATGTTTRLPTTPPLRARARRREPARFELPPLPPADGMPGEGRAAQPRFRRRPARRRCRTSARRADDRGQHPPRRPESYARYPVLVGHYRGDTIVSAEAALDRQLDGALSRRLDLGLYPGSIGQHALFFNKRPSMKPGGAIVVGLGQVGELTPGLLEAGVRAALLDYALQVVAVARPRFGPAGRRALRRGVLPAGGHRRRRLTVRDSLEQSCARAIAANAAAAVDTQIDEQVTIDKIEFLEIFEDVAIAACRGLQAVLRDGQLANAVRWPGQTIEPAVGGEATGALRRGPGVVASPRDRRGKGRRDVLRFIFATDRARAEETLASGQLALADVLHPRGLRNRPAPTPRPPARCSRCCCRCG
jgi:hypothetical protein